MTRPAIKDHIIVLIAGLNFDLHFGIVFLWIYDRNDYNRISLLNLLVHGPLGRAKTSGMWSVWLALATSAYSFGNGWLWPLSQSRTLRGRYAVAGFAAGNRTVQASWTDARRLHGSLCWFSAPRPITDGRRFHPSLSTDRRQTVAFLWLPSARLARLFARFGLLFWVGGQETRRQLSKDYLRVGRPSPRTVDRRHLLGIGP